MTNTSLRRPGAGGGDHAFAQAELHLPRRQVGDADDQPADEVLRLVGFLDAGEDVASSCRRRG